MSVAPSTIEKAKMTIEEFLELPDDGADRWFIDGEVRPKERQITRRNRDHTRVAAKIAYILGAWLVRQSAPRGIVHSGEIGFRLRPDPDILVGIDVAYAPAELVAAAADLELPFYDGSPTLAVEVISPSDRQKDVFENVELYLESGVVAWVIYPDFRIVHVHRPGGIAESYTAAQEIDATPYLPGLRVSVAAIFEV